MSAPTALNGWQQFLLVLIRFSIGWHLFYQGFGKLQAVHWTAEPYLRTATGPLASLFQTMAANSKWLALADQGTMWGLIILGLLLMVGLFTRAASVGAMLLLLLFYSAQPPFPVHGFSPRSPDGSELYVNKVWIEVLALAVAYVFNTGRISGLDMLWRGRIWKRRIGQHLDSRVTASAQDS